MIRPPIITIMGHVDHGKTSLLDYIRKSRLTAKEHGGITQHIGAYQISSPYKITFIDTPGHAAFAKMRARGGQAADIVVLVIAANESIKPQTTESLQHIKDANVPFIVAINKIDMPEANIDRIKQDLVIAGYPPEDMGGNLVTVPISAVSGQGIDQLLEMINLLAEMQQLQADSTAPLSAIVIESKLDKNRGPIANTIIKNGTLKTGQIIHADQIKCKVKAIYNDQGENIPQAGPSTPVQILGFSSVPEVGSNIYEGEPEDNLVQKYIHNSTLATYQTGGSLVNLKLNIILRADTHGSLEAILSSIPEGVAVIDNQIGEITENDILLAKTTGSQIIGFHCQISKPITRLADNEQVVVKSFTIIYELFNYLEDQYKRLIDPLYGIEIKGEADILAEFKINKIRVAGAKVITGEILKENQLIVMRDQKVIKRVKIKSLRQGKQEVNKVSIKSEFGIIFAPYVDFKVNDHLIAY